MDKIELLFNDAPVPQSNMKHYSEEARDAMRKNAGSVSPKALFRTPAASTGSVSSMGSIPEEKAVIVPVAIAAASQGATTKETESPKTWFETVT